MLGASVARSGVEEGSQGSGKISKKNVQKVNADAHMCMRAQGVNLEPKWQKSSRILEMEDDYILVTDGNNTYEIKLEDDESVTVASLRSFFGEEATGLVYNNIATGRFRIFRLENEAVVRPKAGWDLDPRPRVPHTSSSMLKQPSTRFVT